MKEFILRPIWLQLVFEKRNQAYGAFILRQEYEKNSVLGLLFSQGALIGVFSILWLVHGTTPTIPIQKGDIPYFFDREIILGPKIKEDKQEIKPKHKSQSTIKPNVKPNVVAASFSNQLIPSETGKTVELSSENPTSTAETPSTSGTKGPIQESIEPIKNEKIPVVFADTMPVFPQEFGEIHQYINKRLSYTREASNNGVAGRAVVQFVVNEDGSLSSIEVVKKLGYGLDEEVEKLIKNMPKWKPGKSNGETVKVRLLLPIQFKNDAY